MKTHKIWWLLYQLFEAPTDWLRSRWATALAKQTGEKAF